MNRRDYSHQRNLRGSSLIELMVTVAVLGVAIAGITDLLWMNTSWTQKFLNKTSASYSADLFLKRLADDFKYASSISNGSTSQTLTLYVPSVVPKTENPFPDQNVKQITYSITGNTISRIDGSSSISVLRNVIGPKSLSDSTISIFQYVSKEYALPDTAFGVRSAPNNGISSVLVNLELVNRDFGSSNQTTATSGYAPDLVLRSEFFARNELSMDK